MLSLPEFAALNSVVAIRLDFNVLRPVDAVRTASTQSPQTMRVIVTMTL